jgi:hypothetical protein
MSAINLAINNSLICLATNKFVLNPAEQQHLWPELLHLSKQQRF